MAAKMLRAVVSWVEVLFQPPVIALTMVLSVLFVLLAVDMFAMFW